MLEAAGTPARLLLDFRRRGRVTLAVVDVPTREFPDAGVDDEPVASLLHLPPSRPRAFHSHDPTIGRSALTPPPARRDARLDGKS
ncbi:MAG: hypothetical protein LBJ87_00885, partial [bacterium]|nr:hypothetical protein [bacterium]